MALEPSPVSFQAIEKPPGTPSGFLVEMEGFEQRSLPEEWLEYSVSQ